ncbi:MAG: hypothetical protein AAF637_22995, partial [Pseudomonadota bacterium]
MDFANAIAPVRSPISLEVAGRSGTLRWEAHPTTLQAVAGLDLTLDGMPALVLLHSDPVGAVIDLPLTAGDLAALPASYQGALLAQAIDDVFDLVTSGTGLSPDDGAFLPREKIAQSRLMSDPEAVELGWRIVDDKEDAWLQGGLRLSANLAERVLSVAASGDDMPSGVDVDSLVLHPRIEVGSTSLTTGELGTLEANDVVLVMRHRWQDDLVTIIIADNLRYVARVDDDELTVVAGEETTPVADDE